MTDLRHTLLDELRVSGQKIEPAPVSMTLFGSFARGDDDAASDIDVAWSVRPPIDEDDMSWIESIASWETHVRRVSGTANRIEVAEDEVPELVRSRRPLWAAIVRDGIILQGRPLGEIEAATHAERDPHSPGQPVLSRVPIHKGRGVPRCGTPESGSRALAGRDEPRGSRGISASDAICGARTGAGRRQ